MSDRNEPKGDGEDGPGQDELRAGGCLCGAVRFQARGRGTTRSVCHCRSCQLATGAAAGVAWAAFKKGDWRVIRGELATVESSAGVTRGFCSSCGSAITYSRDALPEELDVAVATFDSSAGLEPEDHIFVADKPAWVEVSDELPQFQGWRTTPESDET